MSLNGRSSFKSRSIAAQDNIVCDSQTGGLAKSTGKSSHKQPCEANNILKSESTIRRPIEVGQTERETEIKTNHNLLALSTTTEQSTDDLPADSSRLAGAQRRCSCKAKSAPELYLNEVKDNANSNNSSSNIINRNYNKIPCPWCIFKKSHSIEGRSRLAKSREICCTCCCGSILPPHRDTTLSRL